MTYASCTTPNLRCSYELLKTLPSAADSDSNPPQLGSEILQKYHVDFLSGGALLPRLVKPSRDQSPCGACSTRYRISSTFLSIFDDSCPVCDLFGVDRPGKECYWPVIGGDPLPRLPGTYHRAHGDLTHTLVPLADG
jgi:hypothetical protein